MPKLNTTTSGIITATLTADSSPTLELQQNGVAIRTLGESQLVMGTAVTASGTAIDFTGIPSWAKRITVMFNGISTNSNSVVQVQLGSGSFTTSGYTSIGTGITGVSVSTVTNNTTGFGIGNEDSGTAATRVGSFVFTNISGNIWIANIQFAMSNSTRINFGAGNVTLSGTLDRVRITTVNGTDTFDAGTVNIMWE